MDTKCDFAYVAPVIRCVIWMPLLPAIGLWASPLSRTRAGSGTHSSREAGFTFISSNGRTMTPDQPLLMHTSTCPMPMLSMPNGRPQARWETLASPSTRRMDYASSPSSTLRERCIGLDPLSLANHKSNYGVSPLAGTVRQFGTFGLGATRLRCLGQLGPHQRSGTEPT